jgi:hypothetical protein
LEETTMRMTMIRPALAATALSAFLLTGMPAFAEMVAYKADLTGKMESPANDSKGTGTLDASYDTTTKKLSWTATYMGTTGPATAAHFHGPAAVGANAPPLVPLTGSMTSPMKGDAMLTDAQAADLAAGKMYFNIHTDANKGGELRGQVMKR